MDSLTWIVKNMIADPTEIIKPKRPSELELQVQRSLEKMTVPDWYTNNKCDSFPNIIMDRRPFETRPSPWKDPIRDQILLKYGRKKGKENTAVLNKEKDNTKISKSEMEKLNEIAKVPKGNAKYSYSSKTLPRVSPSRKIQNINIVFPNTTAPPKVPIEPVNDAASLKTNSSVESISSIDFFNKFNPPQTSSLRNHWMSIPVSIPIETNIRASDVQGLRKITKMNSSLAVPKTPPCSAAEESFESQDQSVLSSNKLPEIEKILIKPGRKFEDTGRFTSMKAGNISRMNSPAPPIPLTPATTLDQSRSSSSEDNVFSTSKKSAEMQKIMKNEQKQSSSKSLVEEIIQELNAKCNAKVKSSYVPPASTNFVKELVRALEMGYLPQPNDESQDFESFNDTESKSEPSLLSVSIKSSNSGNVSDTEVKSTSPASGDTDFHDFAKVLKNLKNESTKSMVSYFKDGDDSVCWISMPNCKLPRTSSLKSMMSRLSSNHDTSPSDSRPSISSIPDREALGEPSSSYRPLNPRHFDLSGWGKTYDKKQPRSRRLLRIGGRVVMDSGYSEKSVTNSSSSSAIEYLSYNDSETTRTASENGANYDNPYRSQSRAHRIPDLRKNHHIV